MKKYYGFVGGLDNGVKQVPILPITFNGKKVRTECMKIVETEFPQVFVVTETAMKGKRKKNPIHFETVEEFYDYVQDRFNQ